MKHMYSSFRDSSRAVHPVVHLVTLLVSLGLYASAGVCAESDSMSSAALPFDYRVNAELFAPMPWMCCTDSDSINTGVAQQACGGGAGSCDEQLFDTDFRDRAGLKRDTWYFLGYQAATIGILYMLPESVSSWSDEQKDGYSMSVWWDNVTNPQIDSDDFYINYLLHPYWGAAYFVRARERGYNNTESFWYSALLSSAYEFGAEALFEEPSIQDLIVTPVVGSLVGRYFMRVRGNIREREAALGYRSTKDKWLSVLTDPLGSLNRQIDKLFGWEAELQIRPYSDIRPRDPGMPFRPIPRGEDRVYGLEIHVRW